MSELIFCVFVSVKANPRSVKIKSYNDTMKDKLTDIEKRVSRSMRVWLGVGGGGVWYSIFIKNLAHYSPH